MRPQNFVPINCHLKPDRFRESERTAEQVAKEGVSMKARMSREESATWETFFFNLQAAC